jgi:hypothetical protein
LRRFRKRVDLAGRIVLLDDFFESHIFVVSEHISQALMTC